MPIAINALLIIASLVMGGWNFYRIEQRDKKIVELDAENRELTLWNGEWQIRFELMANQLNTQRIWIINRERGTLNILRRHGVCWRSWKEGRAGKKDPGWIEEFWPPFSLDGATDDLARLADRWHRQLQVGWFGFPFE